MPDADDQWMQRALELAERGRGHVEPNPLVGAVVVNDGKIVGEGWHRRFGEAHAEVYALGEAGEAARGATLYVTLEPCCHHGKTPPCTDAILQAGVARVAAAMSDPFPQVAGGGVAKLTAAGVSVEVGLEEAAARRLNAPYLKLLATGRPYVHAKWAMTLDGKIATRTGDSKWISNAASRQKVHELRGRVDAIIVGSGTALADDPLLTCRLGGQRTPVRVVLDSQARLPTTSRLAQTARETAVLLAVAKKNERAEALRALGCEVLEFPDAGGRVALMPLLDELGRRRMTNVLVEGGSGLLGSFLDAGAIDECHVFVAPALVGGAGAKTPIAGQGFEKIAQALRLEDVQVEMIEQDLYIRARRRINPQDSKTRPEA